jgi:hypothetical protein
MSTLIETVSRERIAAIEPIIRPHIRRTPVMELDPLEFGLEAGRLTLKLELFQHSGSFKVRGAFTNLLTRSVPPAGVVAASRQSRRSVVRGDEARYSGEDLCADDFFAAKPGALRTAPPRGYGDLMLMP